VDFNASKTFPIFERMNLQFRAELFNLLNQTNYSTPDNGVQDAQFGQILSAAGPGREVQFALKLVYGCIVALGSADLLQARRHWFLQKHATWQNKIRWQDEAQRFAEEPDNGCRRFIVLWTRMVSGDYSLGCKEAG
jgi:hypothetical protein